MIKEKWAAFKKAYDERSTREQLLLLIIFWVIIYLFCKGFFLRPLHAEKEKTAAVIRAKQNELKTVQQQVEQILTSVQSSDYLKHLAKQRKLIKDSQLIEKNIPSTEQIYDSIHVLLNDLLKIQKNMTLIHFVRLPATLLTSEGPVIAKFPNEFKSIYKHPFELAIRSDYKNTLYLLEQLENIKSDLYWESLHYLVTEYPEATVTIKFYFLSREKNEQKKV